MIPFVLLVFGMGVFPHTFLKYSSTSLNYLHKHKTHYKLNIKISSLKKTVPSPSNITVLLKEGEDKEL